MRELVRHEQNRDKMAKKTILAKCISTRRPEASALPNARARMLSDRRRIQRAGFKNNSLDAHVRLARGISTADPNCHQRLCLCVQRYSMTACSSCLRAHGSERQY